MTAAHELDVTTVGMVRCHHGVDCMMRMSTVRTDTGYKTTVTESICKACLREIADAALSKLANDFTRKRATK